MRKPDDELHQCSKCRERMPASDFHCHKSRRSGLAAWCKPCCAANMRVQYSKRRSELIAKATANNRSNPNRKAIANKSCRKASTTLSDTYMRRLIAATSGIPYAAAPDWLIAVERERLKLKRLIKEMTA